MRVYAWLEEITSYDCYYSDICLLSEDGWALVTFPEDLLMWVSFPWDETFMINLIHKHTKTHNEELEIIWLNDPYSNEDWLIARCYHKLFEAAGLV